MAVVTMKTATYTGSVFPTDERLVVRFVPSDASTGSTAVFPAREVKMIVPSDGNVTVNLVQTAGLIPATWYTVRFEWFDKHPVTDEWDLRGWSELPGRLNVPAEGGDVTDLMGEYLTGLPLVYLGFGAPPAWLPSGGIYYDLSSTTGVDIYSDGVSV